MPTRWEDLPVEIQERAWRAERRLEAMSEAQRLSLLQTLMQAGDDERRLVMWTLGAPKAEVQEIKTALEQRDG